MRCHAAAWPLHLLPRLSSLMTELALLPSLLLSRESLPQDSTQARSKKKQDSREAFACRNKYPGSAVVALCTLTADSCSARFPHILGKKLLAARASDAAGRRKSAWRDRSALHKSTRPDAKTREVLLCPLKTKTADRACPPNPSDSTQALRKQGKIQK